jgi:hypothetical protein
MSLTGALKEAFHSLPLTFAKRVGCSIRMLDIFATADTAGSEVEIISATTELARFSGHRPLVLQQKPSLSQISFKVRNKKVSFLLCISQ